jgi:hypothetical protein
MTQRIGWRKHTQPLARKLISQHWLHFTRIGRLMRPTLLGIERLRFQLNKVPDWSRFAGPFHLQRDHDKAVVEAPFVAQTINRVISSL